MRRIADLVAVLPRQDELLQASQPALHPPEWLQQLLRRVLPVLQVSVLPLLARRRAPPRYICRRTRTWCRRRKVRCPEGNARPGTLAAFREAAGCAGRRVPCFLLAAWRHGPRGGGLPPRCSACRHCNMTRMILRSQHCGGPKGHLDDRAAVEGDAGPQHAAVLQAHTLEVAAHQRQSVPARRGATSHHFGLRGRVHELQPLHL